MARRLRNFLTGHAYHVFHRGNRKTDIFLDDVDRGVYLKLLRTQCINHHVRIWAYALMSNHVHHVAVPDRDRALNKVFHHVFGEYARYRWSSAAAHCGLRVDPVISLDLPLLNLVADWHAWLAKEETIEDLEFIRERTRTGQPCASDEFMRELEAKIGGPVLRRKPGPKKKEKLEDASTHGLFPE